VTDPDVAAHRAAFARLHDSGCFVIPNPWDMGSARYLRHLGFKALATTSSGFAFTRGLPDEGGVTREAMLGHVAEIASHSGLPVNADFQSGYARDPRGVEESVRLCVAAGVSGLSIEDSTGDPDHALFDLPVAVERVRAALRAVQGTGVLLTARAECFLVGHPRPLEESIRRLRAYSEAGAHVLYAPGPRDAGDVREIVAAVAPKPVNVLLTPGGLKVEELAALGARRLSVGSVLARAGWTGFLRAARTLASEGSFAGSEALVSYAELEAFFKQDARMRSGA
jgi:2-methylisocitrate lyase-like PEP mutase family enzyme